jgi:hypothetical protein
MTGQITPSAHSDLVGGSTASRRIGCPRSYSLEQLVPKDDRGSIYAQEGTALHEMMALVLQEDREPTDMLPFTFTSKDGSWAFTVTTDLWEDKGEAALQAFDTFVMETENRIGAPMSFLIETSVEFPGVPGAFGTSDIIARCGPEIFVLDWKFGRGIVPAEENKQLMFYACGALNTARSFFDGMHLHHATPVTLVIIQPALSSGIDPWTTDLLRLHHFEIELQTTIETIRAEGVNAHVQDGPWCTFARCKVICPLHVSAAAKLSTRFGELQARLNGTAPPTNTDWPERYADLLDLVDMVEAFCTEVRERTHHAAEQGMTIPGWVLEQKRPGPRKWRSDEEEVVEWLTNDLGYDMDKIAPRKVLTLPQAEKILKKDDRVIPDEMMTRPEPSGTKLVRATKATEPVESKPARAASLAEKLLRL